jgi:hypothetical protein
MKTQFVSALFMVACASTAWSYQEIEVKDGGTIAGTVRMTEGKPIPKAFNLITFPDPVYCGRISTGTGWRILDEFSLSADRGLKDTVVFLLGATKGKPFNFVPPTIEARDCRFLPFVTVVKDRAEVRVVNMDPVFHDIQAYETSELGPRVIFNTPLPMNPMHKRDAGSETHEHLAGQPMIEVVKMTKNRRFFVMQCGFHAYMESWGFAVDNPYYMVTDSEGRFSLSDVPVGDYTLMAWHPGVGTVLEKKVSLSAKETLGVDFTFESPKGRRSVHEMTENPHFGLGALGKPVEITPTLELQTP